MKRRHGARNTVRHSAFHDRKPSFFQMPEGVGVKQAAQTLQHLVRTEPLRPVPQIEFVVETGRVLPLIVLQNGFGLVQRLHQLRFGRPARLLLLPHSAQLPSRPFGQATGQPLHSRAFHALLRSGIALRYGRNVPVVGLAQIVYQRECSTRSRSSRGYSPHSTIASNASRHECSAVLSRRPLVVQAVRSTDLSRSTSRIKRKYFSRRSSIPDELFEARRYE